MPPEAPRQLAIGLLSIDLGASADEPLIVVRGEEVALTKRERAFLQYLLARVDTWVPKDDLYRDLWEPPRAKLKIVDVMLCKIRKKINQAMPFNPLPSNRHYLVADHNGHLGFFTTLKRRDPATRGGHSGIKQKLLALQSQTKP